jgi:ABC-type Fe3+-siderophore transport system permease subunit
MGGELQRAPLEPFSYFVIRNYPLSPLGNAILLGAITGISFLIFGIILYNSLRVKEKEGRIKGLLYGLGIFFLIAPMAICTLISPIYARIGYLIGAILIYKALGMKISEQISTK